MFGVKRREFITLLGGSAVAWPLAARAQQADRMRRIAVWDNHAEDDSLTKAELASFREALVMGGRTHDPHRLSLYRRQSRSVSSTCERTGCAETRPDRRTIDTCYRSATARYQRDSSCVCQRVGSDRIGVCRQLGAARRQSHRSDAVRGWHHGEV